MRLINRNIKEFELGTKIGHHLSNYEWGKQADKQKIRELNHVGNLLANYFPDFEIIKVQEKPDFLISNGIISIGLEHELIVDSSIKEREGSFVNISEKIEARLQDDLELPNFLVKLSLKDKVSYRINEKNIIIEKLSQIVKHFILTGELIENEFVVRASKMKSSFKSVYFSFGAYCQNSISEELILNFIGRKEGKVEGYRHNSVLKQWLVLVIGGGGESSFEVLSPLEVNFTTMFDKVFLFEHFNNRLFELK